MAGASRDSRSARGPGSWLRSLRDAGIYTLNPSADEIDGLRSFTLTDIPGSGRPRDYSAIPAAGVLATLEDAAVKGVRSVDLLTAGLAETGISERCELQQLPTDPGSVAFFF